jgi:RNA polymerase sigma factor (sigma-70 family)
MLDDRQLLARYSEGSEAAFAEIVSRYVNLVYSAALRRTGGNVTMAQDISQLVFTDLARKAGSLPGGVVLAGWLHRATRFGAAQLQRTEQRRQAREQAALAMNAFESESPPSWESIRPVLDQALDRLNRQDRDALLLRFFEQRSLAEVGQALGSNEEAARKRVSRALEKLRSYLGRRGVTTTASALSVAISTNALAAAPSGLAATLSSSSLAGAAAGTGTTLALLNLMAATKLKLGLAALVIGSTALTLVIQHQAQARLSERDNSLKRQTAQLSQLRSERERFANPAPGNSRADRDDLSRLRTEAEALREQTNILAGLETENRRLQTLARNSRTLLEEREEYRIASIARLNFSKRWMLAFLLYADKNKDRFPTSFDQAAPFFPEETSSEDIPLSTDQFEIVYQGTLADTLRPSEIIVIREKQPRQIWEGSRVKAYGFADGHSEIRREPPEGFDEFEKQHTLPPRTP